MAYNLKTNKANGTKGYELLGLAALSITKKGQYLIEVRNPFIENTYRLLYNSDSKPIFRWLPIFALLGLVFTAATSVLYVVIMFLAFFYVFFGDMWKEAFKSLKWKDQMYEKIGVIINFVLYLIGIYSIAHYITQ